MNLFRKYRKITNERKINDDVQDIINFFVPKYEPSDMDGFDILKYSGIITFRDKQKRTKEELIKIYSLKSLEIRSIYSSFLSWQADLDEYNDIYCNKELGFFRIELSNINELIKNNENNIYYSYTLIRYEDTIKTILNTLEESKEINGYVDYLVRDKSISLLKKFVADVSQCEKELRNSKQRDIQATNKSLLERLENEERYISQFVNTN